MRILDQDLNAGFMEMRVDNIDDLWHLYNLIREGDHVFSYTQRREDRATDKLREKRGEKKTVYLGITVERMEFHEFSDRLRVHGIILPDQMDSGSHHTLNLQEGSELRIIKRNWNPVDIQRIQEAERASKKPKVLVISLDEDEALIALIHQYGIHEIVTIPSGRSGKQYIMKLNRDQYFQEIIRAIKLYGNDLPLIIAGPGFTKEELVRFGRANHHEVLMNAVVVATGQTGRVGINEIMRSGGLSRVTHDIRVEFEINIIERFLEELSTTGNAAYGYNQVVESINRGAAEMVLITDRRLREKRGEAENLLIKAEAAGAETTIISASHDAGKQLEALGGYASILRFRID